MYALTETSSYEKAKALFSSGFEKEKRETQPFLLTPPYLAILFSQPKTLDNERKLYTTSIHQYTTSSLKLVCVSFFPAGALGTEVYLALRAGL